MLENASFSQFLMNSPVNTELIFFLNKNLIDLEESCITKNERILCFENVETKFDFQIKIFNKF